ncbi:MAG: hypothetical protein A3E78_03995 [Alphaproteobacteria bacterium RIFCSPHIGHO2_12_FULL_63_12]|nr:MAG: hypothetical protein A3E78_03995 [Alphaproteobacteria bacterium RIFCSPHIGHO2_12_FULL_63_12]
MTPVPKPVSSPKVRLSFRDRFVAKIQAMPIAERQARYGFQPRKALAREKPMRAVGRVKVRRLAEYATHLRSAFWKALRRVVFERDGYRCVDCGAEAGYYVNGQRDIRGLECDHLHYRTLFLETPADCATRCRPCHRAKHRGQWWKRIPAWALRDRVT